MVRNLLVLGGGALAGLYLAAMIRSQLGIEASSGLGLDDFVDVASITGVIMLADRFVGRSL